MAARILCVEPDQSLLASRCKVIESAGYDTSKASPQFAEIILSSQKFDLVVISNVDDFEMNRIVNLSDDAELIVLNGFVYPLELLSQVADRLQRRQKANPLRSSLLKGPRCYPTEQGEA